MIDLGLTDKQKKDLDNWKKECYVLGVELQKKEIQNPGFEYTSSWDIGYPYTGAIGGQFTYLITPTSLGDIVVVEDAITNRELNLTDYEVW